MALPETGNPNVPAPGPQQGQVQEMMPGGGQAGPQPMQAQPPDPAQMVEQMGMQLAQAIGPEQAGALFMQVGQQIAQAGQGQQPPQPPMGV